MQRSGSGIPDSKQVADPEPAVILNADPGPAAFLLRIRIQLEKMCTGNKLPYKEFFCLFCFV